MSETQLAEAWGEPDALPDSRQLEAYFDHGRQKFWIQNSRGGWIEVGEKAIARVLIAADYLNQRQGPEPMSEVQQQILRLQTQHDVAYAGPLAGYSCGVTEICGNRILVTSSPRIISAAEGPCDTVLALLENLFVDQLPYVLGWLKVADEALRVGHRRPGQALALAGPRNSGKSLFQNLLTLILGGRAAKPYRYMSGATAFNGELLGAEHLMIEDEFASTDIRSRRHFGARIKEVTVNEVQSCHSKNRQAISMIPFWRLSISLNEEPENLLILPPFDESLADKIMLLKVRKQPMPMRTNSCEERAAFWKTLQSELPAFLYFLSRWDLPEGLRCGRFGVQTYHHPELLSAIDSMSPQLRLLELIDAHYWPGCRERSVGGVVAHTPGEPSAAVRITASELEGVLAGAGGSHEARRLLDWPNATGTYLGRLAKTHPTRVTEDRTASTRYWVITAPPESLHGPDKTPK